MRMRGARHGVRRPSRGRAWAAVAGLLLALSGLAGPAAADDTPERLCPPGVVLEGSAEARKLLAAALAVAGLRAPPAGCPATRVAVRSHEGNLVLDIQDVFGRASRRVVGTVAAASAVVESRARGEVVMALVTDRERAPPPTATETNPPVRSEDWSTPAGPAIAERPEPHEDPEASVSMVRRLEPSASPLTAAVATELSHGTDGSAWLGLAFAGGVALGPVCVGSVVRMKKDISEGGDSAEVIRRRAAVDLSLSIELPRRVGPLQLRPGIEIGIGWVHRGAFAGGSRGADSAVSDHSRELDQGGARAGAQLAAAWRLRGRWHLFGTLGSTLSLFAHTLASSVDGVLLPGEPRAFARVGIGLRYGDL